MICPITNKVNDFAQAFADRLKLEGFQVNVDLSESTLNKKVRNAQLDQYNFIAVVGEEERNGGYIDLRERDKQERLVNHSFPSFHIRSYLSSINRVSTRRMSSLHSSKLKNHPNRMQKSNSGRN